MTRQRETIFEFHRIGAYMRVTAMDTKTLTEVTVSGPASASQEQLKSVAMRKLAYVIKKNRAKE